ncbi:mannose-6-phosphate isomerase, class I [Microbacterium sp. 179-B 1A2 NHS]|uniref:mannose-6-phosphate isomerase, class I n=1 Tax=Microbacterium sp. 179-B 1A2 NHS TaxID=3142383 RepID=UPI0039A33C9D
MLEMLSNAPRDYSWGSASLIPALQGREPTGEPEAEVWFGDHPGSPATVPDGRTLTRVRADSGLPPLPYLLKILAASASLSIQAHPSAAQARAGFAREESAGIPRNAGERTYRDDNHKPEIIVALSDPFRALVGLRPLERTRALLAELGDRPGIAALAAALAGEDESAALRAVIEDALSGRSAAIVADVSAALTDAGSAEFAQEVDVLRAIARDFPGDPGLVVALLMNLVVLRPGQAAFAPAGVLHAYQDGLGVELMAASDNVLRGGLTPKHIDVPELMRVVDTRPGPAPLVEPVGEGGLEVFDVGVPDFRLIRVTLDGRERRVALSGPTIVLATDGEVLVSAASAEVRLRAGTAAYAADESAVDLAGIGTVYLAQPGAPA